MKLLVPIFLLFSALIAADNPEIDPMVISTSGAVRKVKSQPAMAELSQKKVCVHRPVGDNILGARSREDTDNIAQALLKASAEHKELDQQLRRCEMLFIAGILTFAFLTKLVMMIGGI